MQYIDNNKLYIQDSYVFKNFILLSDDEKRMVLSWRNDPKIRIWMSNDGEIAYDDHLNFIDGLRGRDDRYYWLVIKNDVPIAVYDIVSVDYKEESAVSGYYLAPQYLGTGEGFPFQYNYKKFFFDNLGFKTMYGYILKGNDRAYSMSTFFSEKPYGVFEEDGRTYVKTSATREGFDAILEEGLLGRFLKYAKANPIDWDELIKRYR